MKTLSPLEWNRIKLLTSILALSIFVIHLLRPELSIDTVSLILIGVALFPWLTPILKHIELPGGVKVELKDLEKLGEEAKDSGLINKKRRASKKTYTFESVALIDPNLALAGVRIEIERILRKLAIENQVNETTSSVLLLRCLVREDALSVEEGVVLSDLLSVLNKAVHGAVVDEEGSAWALSTGIQILEALEAKLS